MKWLDGARARLRLLFLRRDAESRMNREFQLHIEMEAEHLMRAKGLTADEARRQARVAFGGIERHKEAVRDGRGLAWLGGLALDVKLAARLLARYPWLTVVSCAAIAFGIAAGVAGFEVRTQLVNPSLPLDEGAQIVGLRNWDTSRNRVASTTAADFVAWRDSLTRVRDISAVSVFRRNLITDEGGAETVAAAAMTASAFRVTRVSPLLGRTFIEADEDPGAPPVIVIGYDLWTRRFSSDPRVIGRIVRLGREQATVVGVMPRDFVFPAAHALWIPLGDAAGDSARRGGLDLFVFGRLARDASSAHAQAELNVVGDRTAHDLPTTYAQLRPQVVPFSWLTFDPGGIQIALALGNTFLVMLLVLVSGNVALLMFARLWMRTLSEPSPRPVAGTESPLVAPPFWSPDSSFLAWATGGPVKKVSLYGGLPQTFCEVTPNGVGGSWNRDDIILVGNPNGALIRCSASGGRASLATRTAEPSEVHLFRFFVTEIARLNSRDWRAIPDNVRTAISTPE
jgi:hypothetical protein